MEHLALLRHRLLALSRLDTYAGQIAADAAAAQPKQPGVSAKAVLAAGGPTAHQGGQLVEHDHGDVLDGLGQEHPLSA